MTPAWLLALALSSAGGSDAAAPDTALLTFEQGELVAADWIQHRGRVVRSRSVLMQSATREVTIERLGARG